MTGPDANLVLVGFMGTGKSAVGRRTARALGRELVDMDSVIESREGRTIPEIFRDSGEPHFRALERTLVGELAARRNLVISCGGGIVLNPDNVADFARTGVVVCLTASPEVILRRVAHDANRPLLQAPDREARVRELLAKRKPLYDAIPDRVDSSGMTVGQAVGAVLDLFRTRTGVAVPPAVAAEGGMLRESTERPGQRPGPTHDSTGVPSNPQGG
jgi:shikimate kinase